jgi:hypothetical protein
VWVNFPPGDVAGRHTRPLRQFGLVPALLPRNASRHIRDISKTFRAELARTIGGYLQSRWGPPISRRSMERDAIRTRVRELRRQGILPTRRSNKMWIGISPGRQSCFICEEPIAQGDSEYDLDLSATVTVHVHRPCCDIWIDSLAE